jgi:dihydropteroate synthase
LLAPSFVRLDMRVGGTRIVARDRPLVMAVLNVTPDSFSDGGRFLDPERAVEQAFRFVEEGADLLDIGGESTRPGATPVDAATEKARVLPVLERLREAGFAIPISIDTRRAQVAAAAIDAGALIVNDVSALGDPGMAALVAREEAGVVLMHMRGEPGTMQVAPHYEDVVAEVAAFLSARRDQAMAAGVAARRIVLDPGLGFGKRTGTGVEHNASLLSGLPVLAALGQPLLVGASRKRFIGNLGGGNVGDRLPGSLVAAAAAAWGGASVLRVHDVAATRQALAVAAALDPTRWQARWMPE